MKTTTAERDPEALARLGELIGQIHVAMLTTVTPDGVLHSRPMATREFRAEEGEIWFFTSDDGGTVRDLTEENAVNVSYADPKASRYVSVSGMAHVVRDHERASELWRSEFKAWFPKGLGDPHLALLRVKIESAEYWDLSTARMVRLVHEQKSGARARAEKRQSERGEPGEHTKVEIRATPSSG